MSLERLRVVAERLRQYCDRLSLVRVLASNATRMPLLPISHIMSSCNWLFACSAIRSASDTAPPRASTTLWALTYPEQVKIARLLTRPISVGAQIACGSPAPNLICNFVPRGFILPR